MATPEEVERLSALLLSADEGQVAQGRALVASLADDGELDRARLLVAAGDLPRAAASMRQAGVSLDGGALRLLACDLAELAVELVASDVRPDPGRPRRDPRCDEVIAAVRALVAGGQASGDALEALEPLVLAADETGWWETEAVYALLDTDPLDAFDNAARSLQILMSNLRRPMSAAAPPAVRARLLERLGDPCSPVG